jgi:hypothetical protein
MRVLLSTYLRRHVDPQTRARATAVAGNIRADGAAVAARLLLDAVGGEESADVAPGLTR